MNVSRRINVTRLMVAGALSLALFGLTVAISPEAMAQRSGGTGGGFDGAKPDADIKLPPGVQTFAPAAALGANCVAGKISCKTSAPTAIGAGCSCTDGNNKSVKGKVKD